MKKQILKIAGVKSEKEFYKKFPTEEAFMAKHGKELKKAQIGTYMTSEAPSGMYQPADIRGMYDELDYQLTGMTAADRAKMQAIQQIAAQSSQSGGMDMSQLAEMAGAKKGKKIKKAQVGTGGLPRTQLGNVTDMGTRPVPSATPTATVAPKQKFNLTKAIPVIGQVIGGIQNIKAQKEAYRAAKQQTALTDVMAQAAASRPVQQPRRQYVRPEDMAFQPEQMFPSYGVGTNVLAQDGTVINQIGGNPTEIQNMYNPGTLYSDLGYEPLNDSERYKQFYHGGKMHKAQDGEKIGEQIMGILGSSQGQQLADIIGGGQTGGWSNILGSVGGLAPVPGVPFGARLIGSALDKAQQDKIENQQDLSRQNINKIIGQSFGIGIQQQFGSMLRNGGYAQLGESVGADCVKKGTCKAEESREKGYSSLEKASRAADIAGAKLAALEAKQIKQQNRADYADYINERLTGYGDKIKQKDFDAAYQAFAAANPELAKDKLLYTLASKELPKLRSNKEYYLRNVLGRTSPGLGYDTLTVPGLMQAMQKGYGGSQGYLEAWNRGFRQQQDGGTTSPYEWVSHTWQPQVITTFGEHKVKDLLRPPADADMLRAGGHLKEYTPPSAEAMSTERPMMQMGGELETHWGGYAEPMSYNPYLPDGGETIMFRGQSHDESDGKGNTGIGITYGDNPVEVERGEPAVKLQDGGTGESNLTVFGNIKITNAFADMLADPKAKGKKFKTYVADLSKQENKQNKLMDKSIDQLDDLDVQTSFDKLALGTLQANIEGANAKLKDLATKKMDAAALQNAINDTKEEDLLDVTDKGDVLAKKGANIPKAQRGFSQGRANAAARAAAAAVTAGNASAPTLGDDLPIIGPRPGVVSEADYNYLTRLYSDAKAQGTGDKVELFQKEFSRIAPGLAKQVLSEYDVTSYGKTKGFPKTDVRSNIDRIFGPRTERYKALLDRSTFGELPRTKLGDLSKTAIAPKISATPTAAKTTTPVTAKKDNTALLTAAMSQLANALRPSDVEALDPNQLLGEMYALSTNQVEPVWAQKVQPLLSTPVDISLQDILNANQADYNATQRLTGYNPEALSMLNAQKYQANQRVLGEQFRLNQAEKQRVYEKNRDILNQTQLQNLGILDQQYVRQQQALSKTKATTQSALNSIAAKYAQNKLENRTLATYENLYNYRFDPRFRAQNFQVAQFNVPTVGTPQTLPAKNGKKINLNGSIVKALKNI